MGLLGPGQSEADPANEYKDPFDNKDFYSDEFGSDRRSIDQQRTSEAPKPNIRVHRLQTKDMLGLRKEQST